MPVRVARLPRFSKLLAVVPLSLTSFRSRPGGSDFRRALWRGGLGSLGVKAAQAVLAFAVAVTLARLLGPEGYGVYAFALAVLMIIALPAQVGLPHLVVRETAKAQADGDWGLMRGLWRWSNWAVVLVSGLALAVVVAVLWLTDPSPRRETLIIGAALIPLVALASLRAASLRGLRRVVLGQLPESVIRPFAMLAIVLGATVSGLGARLSEPQTVMAAYVAAAVTAFVVGSAMLHRFRPAEMAGAAPRTEPAEWRRAVLPLAMIAGLQLVNNQADIIVLGIFRSDEEVGIYRAVFQMALLVVFGLQAMNQMLQPHFARLYCQGDMARLQRLVTISARAILALALPPVLAFVVFGGELLAWIFGDAYRAGATALAILAVGQLGKALWGYGGNLLTMCGFEKDAFHSAAAAMVLNIVLNFLLIPPYGSVGAALATSTTLITWHVILMVQVWRRTGLKNELLFSFFGTRPAKPSIPGSNPDGS